MNTKFFILLAGIFFHSALCMKDEDPTVEHSKIEIPLQPRVTDSDGKSEILKTDMPHRVARFSSTCSIPRELENSNLSCVSYPSKTNCIQTCMFGYTFSEGTSRQMFCNHIWNKWEPVPEFESCDPFIDCGVTLISGGKVKCFTHFMNRGAICEISCHHYEDKPAIPLKTYGCNIDGSWTPELPFCARAGSGLALVPPP